MQRTALPSPGPLLGLLVLSISADADEEVFRAVAKNSSRGAGSKDAGGHLGAEGMGGRRGGQFEPIHHVPQASGSEILSQCADVTRRGACMGTSLSPGPRASTGHPFGVGQLARHFLNPPNQCSCPCLRAENTG